MEARLRDAEIESGCDRTGGFEVSVVVVIGTVLRGAAWVVFRFASTVDYSLPFLSDVISAARPRDTDLTSTRACKGIETDIAIDKIIGEIHELDNPVIASSKTRFPWLTDTLRITTEVTSGVGESIGTFVTALEFVFSETVATTRMRKADPVHSTGRISRLPWIAWHPEREFVCAETLTGCQRIWVTSTGYTTGDA
jgi:hypothetical protein